jgi:hypothetical protein
MKKEYVKPLVELVEFQPEDSLMDDLTVEESTPGIGEGVEPW